MENTFNTQPQASLGGWLPTGQKVYFTIPLGSMAPAAAYDFVLNYSNTLLAKGLLLNEPGLEAGEQAYSITHIVRSTQPGKDGKPAAPIIYFYHDGLKWSDLKTWLNTPEDIADFERWSGVKLDTMAAYPSSARLERNKNPEEDMTYVVALSPARRVIWKHNPDYVDGSKTEAKRMFERFDIQPVTLNAPPTAPASPPAGAAPAQVVTITEAPKAAENSQSAPNPLFDAVPSQIDELFPDDFSDWVPQWNELKAQKLTEFKAERAFYLILGKLQLFSNTWERDNSIKKHIPQLKDTTLAKAVYIMRHRHEDKPQYGVPANETDLTKKTGKTDDIAASMEKAKTLEKAG